MIVATVTFFATGGTLNLMDPRIVARPGGLWHPFRLFDDSEFTVEGLVARNRFLRSMVLTLVAGVAAWMVVLAIAGP